MKYKGSVYAHATKGELFSIDLEKYADYLSIYAEEGEDVYVVVCRDDTGEMVWMSIGEVTPFEYYKREGQKPEAYFRADDFKTLPNAENWRDWIDG